jgi:hypothetical protein
MTTSTDKLLSIARESGFSGPLQWPAPGLYIADESALATFAERIRQDERERVLKVAQSRYDHEAKGAAHHAGRWHAAYEYHMTRQAAMSDMLDAIRSISTTESKDDTH